MKMNDFVLKRKVMWYEDRMFWATAMMFAALLLTITHSTWK